MNIRKLSCIRAFSLSLVIVISLLSPSLGMKVEAATSSDTFQLTATKAEMVARVTGESLPGEVLPDPNQTAKNWNLNATDLGVVWDATTDPDYPKVMIAFGDSYDSGWVGNGGGGDWDGWRSNLLAISEDTDLSDGLSFSTMITEEGRDDYAKEILYSDKDTSGFGDFTVIPNAGVTVGDRHYIHYFQLKTWDQWTINHAGIAYSDDEGQNWEYSDVKWDTESNFGFASFVKHEGYVYMLGARTGRGYSPHLARVKEADMLEKKRYEYWNGKDWSHDESTAEPLFDAPLSEPSLMYNDYYEKWIMIHGNQDYQGLVMRSSSSLTEGWSGETMIADGRDYAGPYGGYIHPWANGKDLYFLMSEWGPYNVFLMKTTLGIGEPHENLIEDPSFENQATDKLSDPWVLEGDGGLDKDLGFARAGYNNAFLRSKEGWHEISQEVEVKPNTDYWLYAWFKTSNKHEGGELGVRDAEGNVLGDSTIGTIENDYERKAVLFNPGDAAEVTVFAGMEADGDTWIQADSFLLLEDSEVVMGEDPEDIVAPISNSVDAGGNELPKTSTHRYNLLLAGLFLLLLGGYLLRRHQIFK